MNRKPWLSLLAVVALLVFTGTPALSVEESHEGSVTSVFEVEGMTCGGCEAGLRLTVKKLDGVEEVKPSHTDKNVKVTYDPEKVTTDQIQAAIEKLGYTAKLQEADAAAA